MDEVGCPEPAAVLQRIESTRSCWPNWRANSRSVVASASVVTVISLPTTDEWRPSRDPKIPGACVLLGCTLMRLGFLLPDLDLAGANGAEFSVADVPVAPRGRN